MKFVTRSGFFKRGPNKDGHLDSDIIQTISKIIHRAQTTSISYLISTGFYLLHFYFKSVSGSFVVYAGCFMLGISSLFPVGNIRLPDGVVEMNRYHSCVCDMFIYKYPHGFPVSIHVYLCPLGSW